MTKRKKISLTPFYIFALIIMIFFLIIVIIMFTSGVWSTGVNCKGYVPTPRTPKSSCPGTGSIGYIPPGSGCGGISCGNTCEIDEDCMAGLECQSVFGRGKLCIPIR